MTPRIASGPHGPFLLALLLLPAPAAAQRAATSGPPGSSLQGGIAGVARKVDGQVLDLARDSLGRILYCTAGGEVGRLTSGGARTVLATALSGPFPNPLRALAETPDGDIAVLDSQGHVRVLFGAAPPAVLVYSDQFMIQDATDLIVDARGNFLIASATPSAVRAVNWISSDGQRWGYFLVRQSPVQLAHDPLSGGIVVADETNGGNLLLVATGDPYRSLSSLDNTTHPGISSAQSDGDLAAEADGDLYWIAGGNVGKHSRVSGTTTLFAGGFGQLRGVVIAPASGLLSGGDWSLYVAEGQDPTRIHELPGVGSPGDPVADDQGFVPGRGMKVDVAFGFQVFDLAADNDGRLLIGGSLFGSTHYLKRITLAPTPSIATVATSASGLSGIVEGIAVAPDDALFALTRGGVIHKITEGPLQVTTVFSDPAGQITAGKDLALDVDGTLYVATREAWGFGKLLAVSGGVAALLTLTNETRGLAADPSGGMQVSEWNGTGFQGSVGHFDFDSGTLLSQPGFSGMNYTNDFVWGDGDIAVDANGSVYTISEDDWSLVRYDPGADAFARLGSGYLNHPSGLAIAPSTSGSGSTTGWSLYVAEFDNLWEKAGVPAPASTLVDSSLGLGASVAGTIPPRYGRPRAITAAPGATGRARLLVSTSRGWLLSLDPASGAVEPMAGEPEGLSGDLLAIAAEPRGARVLAASRQGDLFLIQGTGVRRLAMIGERVPALTERWSREPQRIVRWQASGSARPEFLALHGWVVWQVPVE